MSRKVADAAAELRVASTQTAVTKAREELARGVREKVIVKIRGSRYQIGPDELDEVANLACEKAVTHIEAGVVTHGNEDAFVNRVAYTTLIDFYRHRSNKVNAPITRHVELDDYIERPNAEPEPLGQRPTNPEDAILEREAEAEKQILHEQIKEHLESAPSAYREVILAHCYQHREIEDLTDDELARRYPEGIPPDPHGRIRKSARNTVDARLSRARRWLQKRLSKSDVGGER